MMARSTKPLQSEAGYIDEPQSRQIDETSRDARPDHTLGQNEPCHSLRRHGRSTSVSGPARPAVGASESGQVRPCRARCCRGGFAPLSGPTSRRPERRRRTDARTPLDAPVPGMTSVKVTAPSLPISRRSVPPWAPRAGRSRRRRRPSGMWPNSSARTPVRSGQYAG